MQKHESSTETSGHYPLMPHSTQKSMAGKSGYPFPYLARPMQFSVMALRVAAVWNRLRVVARR
jgi:hypothetical protein